MTAELSEWPPFPEMVIAEDLQQEREYFADMDAISEIEAWTVAQIKDQEHEYDSECDCSDCYATWDEYQEMNREYERMTR